MYQTIAALPYSPPNDDFYCPSHLSFRTNRFSNASRTFTVYKLIYYLKYKLLGSLQNMRNLYVMLWKQCQCTNFNENRKLQNDILLHNLSKKIVLDAHVNVHVKTRKCKDTEKDTISKDAYRTANHTCL